MTHRKEAKYMELMKATKERRSIRAFLSKPVEKEILEELLSGARWSPSWGNTQPWEIIVITGKKLSDFKEKNKEAILKGRHPNPDVTMPQKWPEINKTRYREIGKRTLESLSIARDDAEGRLNFYVDMMELFNAPVLFLITTDKGIALEYSMLDVGIFVQTLCLLAHERGLGTCIMAASVQYPDIIKEIVSIPETKRIVIGVALGWPDWNNSVNKFERSRSELDECMQWVE